RAVIGRRAAHEALFRVGAATHADSRDAGAVQGPRVDASSDYTGRIDLAGLPPDTEIFVRALFADVADGTVGEPAVGRFRTAPAARRDIRFLWSGDTAGQGWGINPDFGGMRTYETMRRTSPDFFIHSGDTIYADGPILPTQLAEGGKVWRNIVTPEVAKVA